MAGLDSASRFVGSTIRRDEVSQLKLRGHSAPEQYPVLWPSIFWLPLISHHKVVFLFSYHHDWTRSVSQNLLGITSTNEMIEPIIVVR